MDINEQYRTLSTLNQVKDLLEQEHAIQLPDIFDQNTFKALQDAIQNVPFEHAQHPLTCNINIAELPEEIQNNLLGDQIPQLLSHLIQKEISNITPLVIKLNHEQYALMQTPLLQEGSHHVVIGLNEWQSEWGGNFVYHDGEGQATTIPAFANSLSIINKENTHCYLEYVNNHAQDKSMMCVLLILE